MKDLVQPQVLLGAPTSRTVESAARIARSGSRPPPRPVPVCNAPQGHFPTRWGLRRARRAPSAASLQPEVRNAFRVRMDMRTPISMRRRSAPSCLKLRSASLAHTARLPPMGRDALFALWERLTPIPTQRRLVHRVTLASSVRPPEQHRVRRVPLANRLRATVLNAWRVGLANMLPRGPQHVSHVRWGSTTTIPIRAHNVCRVAPAPSRPRAQLIVRPARLVRLTRMRTRRRHVRRVSPGLFRRWERSLVLIALLVA